MAIKKMSAIVHNKTKPVAIKRLALKKTDQYIGTCRSYDEQQPIPSFVRSLTPKNNSDETMASIIFEMKNPYGLIKTKLDKITGFKEKTISQTHINAGIYILKSKLFEYVKNNQKTHITSLFNIFIKKKHKTYVYPIHEFWNEIGDKAKYEKLANN